MRHTLPVYLVTAAAASALACTAILGDFTTGNTAGGDGGLGSDAGDGGAGEGSVGEGGGDSSVDAPPPLKPLACVLSGAKTSFSYAGVDAGIALLQDSSRLFVYGLPVGMGQFRLVVVGGNSIYYADFHDNDMTPVPLVQFNLPTGFVMTALRYSGGAGFTSGIAFMTAAADSTNTTIGITTFSDDAATPVVGPTLADSSSGVLPPNLGGNSLHGTFEVIDPTNKEYLVAVEFSGTDPTKATIAGAHPRGGSGALKTIDTNVPTTQTLEYSIVHDASFAYLLVNPPSNNGPPSGPMPLYKLNVGDMSKVSLRQVGPDAGFYAPFAFQTSQVPETADLAIIQADLNDPNAVPMMRTGQIKLSDLDTFDPGHMNGTALTIAQLPFNKGVSAWSLFPSPSGDQWLGISRGINDGTPGLNFLWLDALGRPRALVSETDGGGGWPNALVGSAAVTLVGAPMLSFASVRIAWMEGQGGGMERNPPLYSMGGNCLPSP